MAIKTLKEQYGIDASGHMPSDVKYVILESLDMIDAEEYLRRGDFSRWIGDVFGDHALERELQRYERRDKSTDHRHSIKSSRRSDRVTTLPMRTMLPPDFTEG